MTWWILQTKTSEIWSGNLLSIWWSKFGKLRDNSGATNVAKNTGWLRLRQSNYIQKMLVLDKNAEAEPVTNQEGKIFDKFI